MSWQATAWAVTQKVAGPSKLILLLLANIADETGGSCYPRQKRLADESGYSGKTVQRHLKVLEDAGLISREQRQRVDGGRTSDLIQLNLPDPKGETPRTEKGGGGVTETGLTSFDSSLEPIPERIPPSPQGEAKVFGKKERVGVFGRKLFEEFWLVYPKRQGANPRAPAEEKFKIAVKNGADPLSIIRGAASYAQELERMGKLGTVFVATAVVFLNQRRWEDYLNADPPLSSDEVRKRFNAMPEGRAKDTFGKQHFRIMRS